MKWANRALAIVLLTGAVPLWRQAEDFPGTTATFPKVTLAVIALLALIMLATSFSPAYTSRVEAGEGRGGAAAMLRPLSVFVVALAGAYLIPLIGFFPAMGAIAAAAYVPLGVSRPALYALSVIVLLVAVYLIFVEMLGVPLIGGRLWQA